MGEMGENGGKWGKWGKIGKILIVDIHPFEFGEDPFADIHLAECLRYSILVFAVVEWSSCF